MCSYSHECMGESIKYIDSMYLVIYDLHVFDIMSAWIILYLKRKDDVLVGFSKLTDLVRVSVFQIYKNNSLLAPRVRLQSLMNDRIRNKKELSIPRALSIARADSSFSVALPSQSFNSTLQNQDFSYIVPAFR